MNFRNLDSLIGNKKTGAKRTNLGISIANKLEKAGKSRYRYSRYSRENE